MWRVKIHADHQEFAGLVRRWQEPIRRLCTRMTGDPHRTRTRSLHVPSSIPALTHPSAPPPTWRIALNLCYDELRRQSRRREFLVEDREPGTEDGPLEAAESAPGPDLQTAATEEGELVRRALLQLPEIYRSVLVLRHYEDLKLAEIAEVLDIPEGTVNSRMAEALDRLSRILEPQLKPAPAPLPAPMSLPKESFVL